MPQNSNERPLERDRRVRAEKASATRGDVSVLDSWWQQLGKHMAANAMEAPNRQAEAFQSGDFGTAPMMGVTKFVGDKIGREFATSRMMRSLSEMLEQWKKSGQITPEDATKIQNIATKHPRVMAHHYKIASENLGGGQAVSVPGEAAKTSGMYIDPKAVLEAGGTLPNAFAEELHHGAQRIGQPDLDPIYERLRSQVGYEQIPYEVTAKKGAHKRASVQPPKLYPGEVKAPRVKAPFNAKQVAGEYEAMAGSAPGGVNAIDRASKPAREAAYALVKDIKDPTKMSETYERLVDHFTRKGPNSGVPKDLDFLMPQLQLGLR